MVTHIHGREVSIDYSTLGCQMLLMSVGFCFALFSLKAWCYKIWPLHYDTSLWFPEGKGGYVPLTFQSHVFSSSIVYETFVKPTSVSALSLMSEWVIYGTRQPSIQFSFIYTEPNHNRIKAQGTLHIRWKVYSHTERTLVSCNSGAVQRKVKVNKYTLVHVNPHLTPWKCPITCIDPAQWVDWVSMQNLNFS